MSFRRWQKLIAARMRKAVLSACFSREDAAAPLRLVGADTILIV